MKLIGGQQLNPEPGDHSLYAELFGRLPEEVRHDGHAIRYVGYESRLQGGPHVRFLGAEVDAIERVPDRMVAWELNDTTWSIWRSGQDRNVADWREEIRWLWRDVGNGRATGEFCAHGPPTWRRTGDGVPRDVLMVANACFSVDGYGPQDDVQLVDYDSAWPDGFSEMARWLRCQSGPTMALRVEHYGSTSIPGMPAKPVIDILVEVPSFQEARKWAIPLLNDETWEYWWYSDHMVFIKRREFLGPRTHHIHMAPRTHAIWNGLVFRDYLRTHSADAGRYADLKRRLALDHRQDREVYTEAKSVLVNEITTKALRMSE